MMQKKIIYEEDAIKAIWDALYDYKGEYDERSSYGVLCNAEEKLMALPSAQPELPRWAQKVEKYHDKALKMPYIKKHRAWALYQAYKEYDRYGR